MTRDEAIMKLFEELTVLASMYQRAIKNREGSISSCRAATYAIMHDDKFMSAIRNNIELGITQMLKRGAASGN